ncbi:zinc finger domain-containing protein [Microvirga makkahensis]|uniref:zinc finger domain-containing protein n=1 Tax=Microvirga makkahensis TaxID=1128670 RepID=UPI003CCCA182
MQSHKDEHHCLRACPDDFSREKDPSLPLPLNVRCPRCGAARGRACTTKAGDEREPHDKRFAKAGGRRM